MKKRETLIDRKSPVDPDEGDVSSTERRLLARAATTDPDGDDDAIHRASLDETDEDGTPLEEKGLDQDLAGDDLDMPIADDEADDDDN